MKKTTRHKFIFTLFLPFVRLFTRLRFNYSCDSLTGVEGPYLLLSNHNTDFDPAFVAVAAGKQLYYVATENITRIPFAGKILVRWFDPIIHFKGKAGMKTVLNIQKRIKEGHNVCMFAEGNRSFNGLTMPIPPVTAKLAKKTGAALVTFRLDGGYFTSPRWSTTLRKGKVHGSVVNVYSPEKLKEMNEEEVYRAIVEDLSVDAYACQEKEPVRFRGKKLAEGLESTLFVCPSCGKISGLHSENDRIFCDCGFSAVYDETGYLHTPAGERLTVTALDLSQREVIRRMIRENTGEVLFSDRVTFCEIDDATHQVTKETEGVLSARCGALLLDGNELSFEEISGLAVSTRNTILLHYEKGLKHTDIKGPVSFSALKYFYLYHFSKEELTETPQS